MDGKTMTSALVMLRASPRDPPTGLGAGSAWKCLWEQDTQEFLHGDNLPHEWAGAPEGNPAE